MANEMRDRLADLLKKADENCERKCITDYEDAILDNADYLIENGVVVPPCKVGDTVYYITGIHRNIIKSAIVEEIIINCNGVSDLFVTSNTGSFENSFDIFFLTKDQAEQKLKEMRGE